MRLRFTKMHGLGNDFVVIDGTRAPFRPDRALLHRLTDRRYGVGCDQVLIVEPATQADVDFNYRIFNADGSEVGQCGNGARCLARFIREQGLSAKDRLRVRTTTSALELRHQAQGQVQVDMGVPRLDPQDIPFRAAARAPRYPLRLPSGDTVHLAAVSMGNPHAVLECDNLEAAPVAAVGSALQQHEAFPQRVNVGFLQIVDPSHARLRVFERGVGETQACGSGACAAVVAGRLWERLGPRVRVALPGGELVIEWEGEGRPVLMTGPAETVFQGELEWPNPAH